jgi:hypothetical protein
MNARFLIRLTQRERPVNHSVLDNLTPLHDVFEDIQRDAKRRGFDISREDVHSVAGRTDSGEAYIYVADPSLYLGFDRYKIFLDGSRGDERYCEEGALVVTPGIYLGMGIAIRDGLGVPETVVGHLPNVLSPDQFYLVTNFSED